jgi:hypothetical protein
MVMTRPASGHGPHMIKCPVYDYEHPLKDEKVAGWFKGELKPPARVDLDARRPREF